MGPLVNWKPGCILSPGGACMFVRLYKQVWRGSEVIHFSFWLQTRVCPNSPQLSHFQGPQHTASLGVWVFTRWKLIFKLHLQLVFMVNVALSPPSFLRKARSLLVIACFTKVLLQSVLRLCPSSRRLCPRDGVRCLGWLTFTLQSPGVIKMSGVSSNTCITCLVLSLPLLGTTHRTNIMGREQLGPQTSGTNSGFWERLAKRWKSN